MAAENNNPPEQAAPAPSRDEPTFIVGIGASAGGLEAIEKVFDHLPPDTSMAFVVVQHLSPDFKSLMDELLARHTKMAIHRVEDGMKVEPNGVYLIPPKMNMGITKGRLRLTEQATNGGLNLPIDIFFTSLAHDAGRRAIGVILSGTGSDGSRGIRDIHDQGGLVIVQNPETAAFDGMPRSAVHTELVDVVVDAPDIPQKILAYATDVDGFVRAEPPPSSEERIKHDGELAAIYRMFRSRYGIDFNYYRASTIHRRLERRIALSHCVDLSSYLAKLESNPAELDALYRDLLVEVTYFFRDPAAFKRLHDEVVPKILKDAGPRGEIRVWVAGCATGEEAYSLAMVFDHCAEQQGVSPDIKIFATDVHQTSLEIASTGVYNATAISKLPNEFKDKYFVRNGELFHVTKELRKLVIFAPHDITKDPPFTRIDLVSCRNVLIYIEPAVQRKVLSLFHFGLKVGGVLMLGPSESVGELAREFDPLDQHWRVFRKLRDVRLADSAHMTSGPALGSIVHQPPSFVATATRAERHWVVPAVYEQLLSQYVPPSLLVNEQFELVHSFGDARKLLEQPAGRPTLDVLKLVGGELRMALSAALLRAKQQQEGVMFQGVRIADGESVNVRVDPYTGGQERMFLVCLEPIVAPPREPVPSEEAFDKSSHSAERIVSLERELDYTKESLQATVEELETSNEELQSTNEELVASNEELQSTNEELHSVNEELYTVNAEHQRKIAELTQLTNDMDNLLRSTEIGTIFLDRELRIRKFTPAIASAFHVMEQDIGRPIEHISHSFDSPDLMDDIRTVLETGQSVEREVRSRTGTPHLNRILPYYTEDREIDGVVATFIDISAPLEAIETALRESEHQLRLMTDNVAVMIAYLDRRLRFQFVNNKFRTVFGRSTGQTLGHSVADVFGDDAHEVVLSNLDRALRGETVVFEIAVEDANRELRWLQVDAVPNEKSESDIAGVFLAITDITDRKSNEQALEERASELSESLDQLEQFNRFSVGREERMIELKQEVNHLQERLGQKTSYDLSELSLPEKG